MKSDFACFNCIAIWRNNRTFKPSPQITQAFTIGIEDMVILRIQSRKFDQIVPAVVSSIPGKIFCIIALRSQVNSINENSEVEDKELLSQNKNTTGLGDVSIAGMILIEYIFHEIYNYLSTSDSYFKVVC